MVKAWNDNNYVLNKSNSLPGRWAPEFLTYDKTLDKYNNSNYFQT